jgi:hypothetical protein
MPEKPEYSIINGPVLMCPKCNSSEHLSRNETVCCQTHVVVGENGKWAWTGDTEVIWETSNWDKSSGELEWRCHNCDIRFNAPEAVQE